MDKFDFGLPKFEDTLFSTEEQRQEARLEKVMKIPISEIHDFKQHPFHVRMDEDMIKLIDSVKENGVLMPALVRPDKNGGYEMVSGHRRKFALEQNGITEIDAIVRELDDDQATIIMVDSNIQGVLKNIEGINSSNLDCSYDHGLISTFVKDNQTSENKSFHVGDKVKVKANSKWYDGQSIASFVFNNEYEIIQIDGDRVVIGVNGKVTGAISLSNLY